MPKKTTRSGAQRNRPKVQKNVSLVRPNNTVGTEEIETPVEQVEETQLEGENGVVESSTRISTATVTATAATAPTTTTTTTTPASTTTTSRSRSRTGRAAGTIAAPATEVKESEATPEEAAPEQAAQKGSASARLAARRQNQKAQQRIAPTLITAEHYSYVRKDLIYIAILAVLMFATIIILHFIPGIGL